MAGFQKIFRITGGFRATFLEPQAAIEKPEGTSFIKRVTGKIFTISK
jgi:hypothetical protein